MIKCTKCKECKDESEFRVRLDLTRGYQSWCKQCEYMANRARLALKPKKEKVEIVRIEKSEEQIKLDAKKRMLKHRYNLTYEEYENMYSLQDKKCAICEREFELGGSKGLLVDHCHSTNIVRGLLCSACNSAIGKLGEDRKIFENAMKYLKI